MHHGRTELLIVIFILSCAKTVLRERERERDKERERDGNGDGEHTSRDDVGQPIHGEGADDQDATNHQQETRNE